METTQVRNVTGRKQKPVRKRVVGVLVFAAATRSAFTGVLFHLDFAALNQQKCKGIWAADSVSSDYETWSPSGTVPAVAEDCFLNCDNVQELSVVTM